MSDLPQEVILKILSMLAVKPLLRFRCVSKQWCAIIDGQEFIKFHWKQTLKSQNDRTLLLSGKTLHSIEFDTIFSTNLANVVELDPPVRCLPVGIEVVGCCNGLIALAGTNHKHEHVFLLWNLSTKQYKQLPEFGSSGGVMGYFGFGYDNVHDEFKVVKNIQLEDPFSSKLSVYSLSSNSWRKIGAFPYNCVVGAACGVFAAGALHWVASSSTFSPGKWIAAFDLVTEKSHLVPLPNCHLKKSFQMKLAVLGGHLCLTFNYEKERAYIWIMKDYGNEDSWTRIASVVSSAFVSFKSLNPISFSKCGKKILINRDDTGLVCYDLEEKSAKNVKLRGYLGIYFQYGVYLGSLVRLNRGGPTDSKGDRKFGKQKRNVKRDGFLSTGFKLVL